jgi:hypothetical protein
MKTCYHCKRDLGFNEEYYVVRKAVKPKGSPYRHVRLGACCETCESEGKPTNFEYDTSSKVPACNETVEDYYGTLR